jgi:hypothetical protein
MTVFALSAALLAQEEAAVPAAIHAKTGADRNDATCRGRSRRSPWTSPAAV